jgi:hypothetical protein
VEEAGWDGESQVGQCPQCRKDHLRDPVLRHVAAQARFTLVSGYADVLEEILLSMRDDAANNRRGAFMSRLRDYKECFFKGLWVGLIATPEQVLHDASGEPPHIMFTHLSKQVCPYVFGTESAFTQVHVSPENVEFTAMGLLNASTHMSPLFLENLRILPDAAVQQMYNVIAISVQNNVATLRYVAGMLKANKPKEREKRSRTSVKLWERTQKPCLVQAPLRVHSRKNR